RHPPRRPRALPLLRGAGAPLRRAGLRGDRDRLLRPNSRSCEARRRLPVHGARPADDAGGRPGRRAGGRRAPPLARVRERLHGRLLLRWAPFVARGRRRARLVGSGIPSSAPGRRGTRVRVADVGESAVERLLSEQRRYYRARAPEYDDWWFRRARYTLGAEAAEGWFADVAELEAELERFAPRGDVLELAAGTGTWTRHLLRWADRVTAVDAVPEVLELNRAKLGAGVDYVLADVFDWEPPRTFDVCFFGFWLSHVPSGRFETFWQLVERALKPDGRVFLVDNAHLGDPRHTVSASGEIVRRSLSDGREFDIVKR